MTCRYCSSKETEVFTRFGLCLECGRTWDMNLNDQIERLGIKCAVEALVVAGDEYEMVPLHPIGGDFDALKGLAEFGLTVHCEKKFEDAYHDTMIAAIAAREEGT